METPALNPAMERAVAALGMGAERSGSEVQMKIHRLRPRTQSMQPEVHLLCHLLRLRHFQANSITKFIPQYRHKISISTNFSRCTDHFCSYLSRHLPSLSLRPRTRLSFSHRKRYHRPNFSPGNFLPSTSRQNPRSRPMLMPRGSLVMHWS